MDDDASYRNQHPGSQLQQSFAQRGHLGPGTGRAGGAQPEFLHQHVGGGGEQNAQLIGPEAAATGAVDLEPRAVP